MNVEVELPDLGPEGGSQARVAEWHFDEGDRVEEGEILCEVMGELASLEVRAPCSGTLLERVAEEDDTVRIGETLAIIEREEDEDITDDDLDTDFDGTDDDETDDDEDTDDDVV